MRLKNCWRQKEAAWLLAALLLSPLFSSAQTSGPLWVEAPASLAVARNESRGAVIQVRLRAGYHVNSNTPGDDYLIPLRLTWDAAPLVVEGVDYPPPSQERYQFSDKPLSVFTGDFQLKTRFRVPAGAPKGQRVLLGKLRYQACTNTTCLPPRTVEVKLPVDVR